MIPSLTNHSQYRLEYDASKEESRLVRIASWEVWPRIRTCQFLVAVFVTLYVERKIDGRFPYEL